MKTDKDFQLGISIDPVSACNLNCYFCTVSGSRDGSIVNTEKLLIALENINDLRYHLKKVFFTGIGEPLLYKDLPDVTAKLKSKAATIGTFTNGVLLTPDLSEKLLKSGMNAFMISVTGLSPKIFSMFQGGNLTSSQAEKLYNTIQDNIKALCELRDKINKDALIRISYILTEDSKSDFFKSLSYYREIGVNHVQTRVLLNSEHYYEQLEANDISFIKNSAQNKEETTTIDKDYLSRLITFVKDKGESLCPFVGDSMQITSHGDLYACCERYDETFLGNVFTNSLVELVNSEKFEKLVGSLHGNYDEIPNGCRKCATAQSFLAIHYAKFEI